MVTDKTRHQDFVAGTCPVTRNDHPISKATNPGSIDENTIAFAQLHDLRITRYDLDTCFRCG